MKKNNRTILLVITLLFCWSQLFSQNNDSLKLKNKFIRINPVYTISYYKDFSKGIDHYSKIQNNWGILFEYAFSNKHRIQFGFIETNYISNFNSSYSDGGLELFYPNLLPEEKIVSGEIKYNNRQIYIDFKSKLINHSKYNSYYLVGINSEYQIALHNKFEIYNNFDSTTTTKENSFYNSQSSSYLNIGFANEIKLFKHLYFNADLMFNYNLDYKRYFIELRTGLIFQ